MPYASLKELTDAQPELVKALKEQITNELKVGDEAKAAEAKVTELTTANTTLTTENKRLTEEVKGYKDKEVLATRIVARDKMIEEAKIPAAFVSDDFRQSVREAADDTRAAAIIKDRQTMAKVAEDKVAEAKKGGKPDFHTAETKTVEGTDKKESKDFDPTTYRKTVGVTEVKTK